MKIFQGEHENQSLFNDDFFSPDTLSELEDIRLMFSSFNPFLPSLPKQRTTASSTFQCSNNTVFFCNKTKPLFVGLR